MIIGVGPLGAQHVIGVASLIGIILCFYQNTATIAPTTTTAKKVKDTFMLSATVLEKHKLEVAEEAGLSEKIIESAYCEMFREAGDGSDLRLPFDEKHHALVLGRLFSSLPKHPDTYFHGQILCTIHGTDLVEMYWDSTDRL